MVEDKLVDGYLHLFALTCGAKDKKHIGLLQAAAIQQRQAFNEEISITVYDDYIRLFKDILEHKDY
jgi:hypothetical protein